jgi:hypothetical protein
VTENPNNRPPIVVAAEWASRITTVALEMALPPALGYWADQWLSTGVVLLMVGGIVGLTVGTWHLIRIANASQREAEARRAERPATEKPPTPDRTDPRHRRTSRDPHDESTP